MKLGHLYSFLNFFLTFKFLFNFNFFLKLINAFFLNYFFNWKISNYGDGYWFLYSNKKSIHELRFVNNSSK